jgi:UDP-glucose 4-epimerase
MYGLNYVVFRPHNVYGEHQNIGDRYRNVIGIFMNQIMQGKPMPIFGDGTQTRAFSYIDDVAPFIAKSVVTPEAWNQIINIGADTPYGVGELARVVAAAFGVVPEIEYLPARNEVLHAWSDHAKARRIFGSSGQVSLIEGVARMAEWARRTGARASREFEDVEVTLGLPPSWAPAVTTVGAGQ